MSSRAQTVTVSPPSTTRMPSTTRATAAAGPTPRSLAEAGVCSLDADVAAGADGTGATLRWRIHPAAAQPARAVAVVAVIALAAALAFSVSGSGGTALVAGLLLAGSLRSWFLPRAYVLGADGAVESGPLQASRRVAWDRVRSISRERHGIHLSPLEQPSRWVRDRGLFLRTDGDPLLAQAVLAFIHERLGT
jgi:hypothetical protein